MPEATENPADGSRDSNKSEPRDFLEIAPNSLSISAKPIEEVQNVEVSDESLKLTKPSTSPAQVPYDPTQSQEKTRSSLANLLLGGSVATLLGVAVYVTFAPTDRIANTKDLVTLVWTSQVTLVSSALGFYFGSGTQRR